MTLCRQQEPYGAMQEDVEEDVDEGRSGEDAKEGEGQEQVA